MRRRGAAVGLLVLATVLISCGGDEDGEVAAGCQISRSELGPFAPDQPVGATMSDAQAQAQKAETGFDSWIEIEATGGWNAAWDIATSTLGGGIHSDLTWIDVDGELTDLYEEGDRFGFTDLKVSRSFQGKIEHSEERLFIGVDSAEATPDYDSASCAITSVTIADQNEDAMLDVLEVIAIEQG